MLYFQFQKRFYLENFNKQLVKVDNLKLISYDKRVQGFKFRRGNVSMAGGNVII